MRREEDRVLDVGAALVSVVAAWSHRDVEAVVPVVAAVRDQVPVAHFVLIGELDVVGLVFDGERQGLPIESRQQQQRRLGVERVDEGLQRGLAAGVAEAAVLERRAPQDVERTQAAVNDPLGPRHTAGEDQFRAGVGHVVVDTSVEPGLTGSAVLEDGERGRGARHVADRPQERLLGPHARRHLVGEPIACRCRVGRVHRQQSPALESLAGTRSVELAEPDRHVRALHLPRRLRDHVDHAGHRVGAPDGGGGAANHLDLLDFSGVDRQEVPQHEREEVLIDRPAVQQHQHGIGQRTGGSPRRDVHVARRCPDRVDAWDGLEQVGHALHRCVLDRLRADDGHRGGCVEELFLASRRGDNQDVVHCGSVGWSCWPHLAGRLLARGGRRRRGEQRDQQPHCLFVHGDLCA